MGEVCGGGPVCHEGTSGREKMPEVVSSYAQARTGPGALQGGTAYSEAVLGDGN